MSAYYARPNALARALPEPARSAFLERWDGAEHQALVGARKSGLAGDVIGSLRELHEFPDLETLGRPPLVGEWFVYSGRAIFSRPTRDRMGKARIKRPDLRVDLTAEVRFACMLTNTAFENMSGTKSGALLLGVATSTTDFELIGAGYQDLLGDILQHGQVADRARWIQSVASWILPDRRTLDTVIGNAVTSFEQALIFRHGSKVLEADAAFAGEKGLHHLFEMLGPYLFDAAGARLLPEVETGLGPVDFLVQRGTESYALEFKQLKSDKDAKGLEHGVAVQLPSYMAGLGTANGWFVIVVQGTVTDEAIASLTARLDAANKDPNHIRISLVDGRPQVSASKRGVLPSLLSDGGGTAASL